MSDVAKDVALYLNLLLFKNLEDQNQEPAYWRLLRTGIQRGVRDLMLQKVGRYDMLDVATIRLDRVIFRRTGLWYQKVGSCWSYRAG